MCVCAAGCQMPLMELIERDFGERALSLLNFCLAVYALVFGLV